MAFLSKKTGATPADSRGSNGGGGGQVRVIASAVVMCILCFELVTLQAGSEAIRSTMTTRNIAATCSDSTNHTATNADRHRLLTVREMKERMTLPCNYVHDGFYIGDSNEILNQVYQSITKHLDDDVIPVVVECGGHDGVTKSQTLKASRCLAVNTLLIEASPHNYRVLEHSRGNYDWTVNAALCEGESITLLENEGNSGETHVLRDNQRGRNSTARCTSIDAELDKLRDTLPAHQQDNLRLIMLILDIEGFEATGIKGVVKYRPHKVFMEEKYFKEPDKAAVGAWAAQHQLNRSMCNQQDACYNFDPLIAELKSSKPDQVKALFYGAREKVPVHTWRTSEASQGYMYYGE